MTISLKSNGNSACVYLLLSLICWLQLKNRQNWTFQSDFPQLYDVVLLFWAVKRGSYACINTYRHKPACDNNAEFPQLKRFSSKLRVLCLPVVLFWTSLFHHKHPWAILLSHLMRFRAEWLWHNLSGAARPHWERIKFWAPWDQRNILFNWMKLTAA